MDRYVLGSNPVPQDEVVGVRDMNQSAVRSEQLGQLAPDLHPWLWHSCPRSPGPRRPTATRSSPRATYRRPASSAASSRAFYFGHDRRRLRHRRHSRRPSWTTLTRTPAASTTTITGRRRGLDRLVRIEAAVRDQIQGAEHPAVERDRQQFADLVHQGPAGAGGEGRAIPDPGWRPLPGRAERPGCMGGRRLHGHDNYPYSKRSHLSRPLRTPTARTAWPSARTAAR